MAALVWLEVAAGAAVAQVSGSLAVQGLPVKVSLAVAHKPLTAYAAAVAVEGQVPWG